MRQYFEAPAAGRPYVISWNLTYRCNLACEHCYLDAGAVQKVDTAAFADRRELKTEQCFEIIEQIAEFAPEAVTILTGGEPLLRRDILDIVRRAALRGLWVVVGTNGVKVTESLSGRLKAEGVRGMALSLDSLSPERHDRFRLVKGAWQNTVDGAAVLSRSEMPFIIQTTIGKHNAGELAELAQFACECLQAKVWNLYFLVQTGRGQYVSDISDDEYEEILGSLAALQRRFAGRMMVNAKCAPHFARRLFSIDRNSPFLKTFAAGAGGCPAGTHYLGIRPNGDVTPCPYLPVFGGNAMEQPLESIWQESEVFTSIRKRGPSLGGNCGSCEFNPLCGGCRARAYGVHGDYLAQDPLCSYEPGRYTSEEVLTSVQIVYGEQTAPEEGAGRIRWSAEAEERIKRVPAFVRPMVIKSVESYCRKNDISHVGIAELESIRARMPTQKLFSK